MRFLVTILSIFIGVTVSAETVTPIKIDKMVTKNRILKQVKRSNMGTTKELSLKID